MTQVFISYSHNDREFVRRLVADLERLGPQIEVFYDMLIAPGKSWTRGHAERQYERRAEGPVSKGNALQQE